MATICNYIYNHAYNIALTVLPIDTLILLSFDYFKLKLTKNIQGMYTVSGSHKLPERS